MQRVKVIDVTRSFVIADPNYFPENQGYTQSEDTPEKMPPILAYEGYNFMPTVYGYRSYFGTNSTLNVAALTSRVDKVLLFQLSTFQNILVALCEDGIWTTTPGVAASAWTHVVTHAVPTPPIHYQWTYCVIENNLYAYKEGTFLVHKYSFAGTWTNFTPCCFKTYATTAARTGDLTYTSVDIGKIVYDQQTASYFTILTIAPTFTAGITTATNPFTLNMAGQKGIFRANGRLGFWDSSNSVSWSDIFDLKDFVTSVRTRAGSAIFLGVKGTIVQILSQGDGYVIYTTKGIVGVRFTNDINLIWEANVITDTAGVAYPFQATTGITDAEHFAYTNTGIKKIGTYNALAKSNAFEEILTDTYDLLKESGDPVYLDFFEGRYLFFSVIDDTYIDGRVSFSYNTIDVKTVRVLENGGQWAGTIPTPVQIAGTHISTHINNQIEASPTPYTQGMYLQWTARSATLVPGRISPVSPYYMDNANQHVDNLPADIDYSPQITAAEVQSLVEAGSYTDASFSGSYANLGWTYPGLGNIATSYEGHTDTYLDEFVITQNEEWATGVTAYYPIIQSSTKALIDAAVAVVKDEVQGGTQYAGVSAAQDYIDAQIAAHAGQIAAVQAEGEALNIAIAGGDQPTIDAAIISTNAAIAAAGFTGVTAGEAASITGSTGANQTSWSVVVGTIQSGAGSIVGPTLANEGAIGVHSMTLTKTFLGGHNIVRTFVRNWSTRLGTPQVPAYHHGWIRVNNYGGTYEADTYSFDSYAAAYSAQPLPPDWTDGVTWSFKNASYAGSPNIDADWHQATPPYTQLGNLHIIQVSVSNIVNIDPYYVDYQDTLDLVTTVNAGLTVTASASAFQTRLDWGYFTTQAAAEAGGFPSTEGAITLTGTGSGVSSILPPYLDITTPGATFLMTDGSAAPVYPTFVGALAFDTALKKWGKLKADYKVLLEMAPVNATGPTVSYTNFGITLSMMDAAGAIKLFDTAPADSWIRYGKMGYSRLGFTKAQEIRVHFRNSSTGNIILDTSLDGRSLETSLIRTFSFTTAASIEVGAYNVGRWHTITVSGNWDLQYMEFRANSAGRR